MKKVFWLWLAFLVMVPGWARGQCPTTNNVALSNWVAQVVATNTTRVVQHLMGPGVGRYPSIKRSSETLVDGYMCSWELESEISVRGIGCCWIFYARKDGKTYRLRDGHGPDYKDGVDQWWEEIEL